MKDNGNILDILSNRNTSFMHASGKKATYALIHKMGDLNGLKVLEIGFGTGATLIELASRNKTINLFGIEASNNMFKKASKRISLCQLQKDINIQLVSNDRDLPFEDNYFDVIYCESVLGILEGDNFEYMIKEIARVISKNGHFYMNETIWLDKTPQERIRKFNLETKEKYGIIQSNEEFPYEKNWVDLLNKHNLKTVESKRIADFIKNTTSIKNNFASYLTFAFTLIGKIRHSNPFKKENKKTNQNIVMSGMFLHSIKYDS